MDKIDFKSRLSLFIPSELFLAFLLCALCASVVNPMSSISD